MPRLRIAAINFLNPAPLMWNFDHEPARSVLRTRYAVETMMPSECAGRLHAGTAEIGLVPLTAYATTPALLIAPGCVIASKGSIRSILLVTRAGAAMNTIRTVAADTSSRASLAYAQILFRKYWRSETRFLQHPPELNSMLAAADAALLIGDPALLALEDCAPREARTGEPLSYIDLGAAWNEATGLPWVSAVWAVRAAAVPDRAIQSQLAEDLLASRDAGTANREALVREWSARIAVPQPTIRTYLTENIHYRLDDDCIEGMEAFFRIASECDVLPPAPPLRMLEA